MCAGQSESRQIVIELGALPLRGAMTLFARCGKPAPRVIGIRAALEIRHMASRAVHWSACKPAGYVTGRAVADGCVRPGERKPGGRIVIELRPLPRLRRMAEGTIARKIGYRMVGNLGRIVIGSMAAKTIGGCPLVLERVVAGVAFERGMPACKGVSGVGLVVEFCLAPGVQRVATLAIGGEACTAMIHRDGVFIDIQMTRDAFRVETLEHTTGCTAVAGLAVHRGMRAHERKTVEVGFSIDLRSQLPVSHRVTVFTLASHLAPVIIGMTASARLANIGEDLLDVTP